MEKTMDWLVRGRAAEVDEAASLLAAARLVTLTGPAGVGKTVFARFLLDKIEAGGDSWFSVDETFTDELRSRIREYAARASGVQSPRLIVLDTPPGCAGLAAFVEGLLDSHDDLRILATSRGRLGVPGERQLHLHPLRVEDLPLSGLPDDDWFDQSPAVAMYLDRVQSVCPELVFSRETLAESVAVCRYLGGLPLALHLAGMRANVVPVQGQLRELERSALGFLALRPSADSMPVPDERALSIRRSFEAGLGGLPPAALVLLRVIARFPGGCSMPALRRMRSDETSPLNDGQELLNALSDLVDAAILAVGEEGPDSYRFTMDSLHRALFRDGEPEPDVSLAVIAIRRHTLARAKDAALIRGPGWEDQARWFAGEYLNMMDHFADCRRRGATSEAIEIADLLYRFSVHSGRMETALRAVESIPAIEELDNVSRARLLSTRGGLIAQMASFTSAYTDLSEAVVLWKLARDRRRLAEAWLAFASAALEVDGWNAAKEAAEGAIAIFQELDDEWAVARSTAVLGALAADVNGKEEFARHCLETSAAALQSLGDVKAASLPMEQLGRILVDNGEYDQAAIVLEHGLAEMRAVGDRFHVSAHLNLLALVDLAAGHTAAAARRYMESLQIAVELGLRGRAVWCLEGLTESLKGIGALAEARLTAAAALSLREELDLHDWVEPCSPKRVSGRDEPELPRAVRIALIGGTVWPPRPVLDSVNDVLLRVPDAIQDRPPLTAAEAGETTLGRSVRSDGLTPREIEILGLLGSGMTSRAIASRLVISIDTVGRHITNLYRKIGARGRADATAYALRFGLVPETPAPVRASAE
ncbi:LuxR C-terminal-related transcriptional regulator [Arthrobacter bambusae]|uniref:LuxR C-terminal-related transcriptional regulator n=1 Tax=Arthrobacter bambusae TaxID=1338426 RepID=UPI00278A9216|nr:LuxR C-terminal-related transcriptional regulator [Arthrobacter bambusae]MDQ0239552.1 DNA-binding CsgD family transcriptional regulator [Arthrobacter bambusae]